MKAAVVLSLMLLIISEFLLIPSAADYEAETQWRLPEGAIARLGKGSIEEIRSSPDRTRLAVASSNGKHGRKRAWMPQMTGFVG